MSPDFFIVFSLSRAGSSALFRALNAHSKINCFYEPQFASANWDEKKVHELVNEIRLNYSGIKHVWDPSGWPFLDDHISAVKEMDRNYAEILRMNSFLLSRRNQKVLFLRRRDQLGRALSDLLGQQTDVWTPSYPGFPNAHIQSVIDEAERYKSQVRSHEVQPVNTDIIAWYLENIPIMENHFRSSVSDANCMDLYYEDLFNPKQDSNMRLQNYSRVLDFLEFPKSEEYWNSQEIDALFDPRGKLNDDSTLNMIPNITEIRQRFGTSYQVASKN